MIGFKVLNVHATNQVCLGEYSQHYALSSVVAVDDTPVGIEAGRNAGCWTVGVTRTGNGVGLSEDETKALPPAELRRACEAAARSLSNAGAHFLVESVEELPGFLAEIERYCERGSAPNQNAFEMGS